MENKRTTLRLNIVRSTFTLGILLLGISPVMLLLWCNLGPPSTYANDDIKAREASAYFHSLSEWKPDDPEWERLKEPVPTLKDVETVVGKETKLENVDPQNDHVKRDGKRHTYYYWTLDPELNEAYTLEFDGNGRLITLQPKYMMDGSYICKDWQKFGSP